MIQKLHAQALEIPFKRSFKHAAAERRTTQSVWVEAESVTGVRGYGEGCPREYVTGESVATALAFIRHVEPEVSGLEDLSALQAWVAAHAVVIDANPAAWCAIELALLDVLARERAQGVEMLLELPAVGGPFFYSAVLGAEPPDIFQGQLERYRQMGFRDFKVKLDGTPADFTRATMLRAAGDAIGALRLDANNLWREPDVVLGYLERLGLPVYAIEEPLASGDYEAAGKIAAAAGIKVILDESFLRVEQLRHLRANPRDWIINLRISKMGGLLRSLEVAEQARAMGIPLILGCQVGETSLLTRAALTLAQTWRGKGLLAQEGAFGTLLLAKDVVARPLMFGAGGELDAGDYGLADALGFGLAPVLPATSVET